MIKYDRLWETMKSRGITQYALYTHYNVNRSQINRLRHNQNVETNTIDNIKTKATRPTTAYNTILF